MEFQLIRDLGRFGLSVCLMDLLELADVVTEWSLDLPARMAGHLLVLPRVAWARWPPLHPPELPG